jgi:hypothetical protein
MTFPFRPASLDGSAPDALQAGALAAVNLRVRLLARRRLLWIEQLFSANPDDIRGRDIGALLDDADDPATEAEFCAGFTDLNGEIAANEDALEADTESRLATLRQTFALSPLDTDILHVCLAHAADPSLGRLFAYLHDDATRPYPTAQLIARLCGHGRFLRWSPSSALRRWRFVSDGTENASASGELDQTLPLTLDPLARDWLAGDDPLDPNLMRVTSPIPPLEPLPEWDVDTVASFAARSLSADRSLTVIAHVIAPPRSGRRTFAANVAARMGMPLLYIDAARIAYEDWETVFIHAQRHAFMNRCALAWGLGGDLTAHRVWTNSIAHFPVQFIIREAGQPAATIPDAVETMIALPAPRYETRRALWEAVAPAARLTGGREALDDLAMRRSARVGDIAAAARVSAAQGGSVPAMADALKQAQRDLLGDLAQPLESPFVWNDLVIHRTQREALLDFVHETRDRAAFWDNPDARRLFPQGRGLVALFSGVSGTGKTMAAQVVAADLGLDLYRIDLSTVVSKYVGETERNIQQILTRAEHMDVVLFFDEADSLFARRTEVKDAHDRFANTETNHLLQAIEQYGGVALLATNRKANIDPAFIRRLRYVIEFAKPDADQRLILWTRFVTALGGADAVRRVMPLLHRLAAEVDVTGAQIKYAVLAAVFAARRDDAPLDGPHLLRGLDRELSKEGRALNERDHARLRSKTGTGAS